MSIPRRTARKRSPDFADIRKEMQDIGDKRRRFGYRLLERKDVSMTHVGAGSENDPEDRFPCGALDRIYREEGRSAKRRRSRLLRNLWAAQAAITFNGASFPTYHGTEFTSRAILKFVDDRKFDRHYIAP